MEPDAVIRLTTLGRDEVRL
jgi:hypothetical protein